MTNFARRIVGVSFLGLILLVSAYSQQVIRETVAPTGVPSAGYSICWIDAGTHVLNCRNAAGETYQPGALEANGQLRVAFPGLAVLPPATSGSIRGVYVFTGAAAPNQCPLSGLGGSGGSSTALCWTDGTLWHAIPLADSNGLTNSTLTNPDLGGSALSNTVTAGTSGVTAFHVVQKSTESPIRYNNQTSATATVKGIARTTATAGNTFQLAQTGIIGCAVEGAVTAGHYWTVGATDKSKCLDSGQSALASICNAVPVGGVFQASGTDGQTVQVSIDWNLHGNQICVSDVPTLNQSTTGTATGPPVYTTLPSTCSVGQSAFVSGNPVGQQGYDCTAVNAWTQRVGKDASGNVTLGTTVLGTASVAPTCSTYTVSSANAGFQAAAVTANITLVALPARAKITGINVKHSVAFAGTAVTSTTVSVGDGTSTFDQYASV